MQVSRAVVLFCFFGLALSNITFGPYTLDGLSIAMRVLRSTDIDFEVVSFRELSAQDAIVNQVNVDSFSAWSAWAEQQADGYVLSSSTSTFTTSNGQPGNVTLNTDFQKAAFARTATVINGISVPDRSIKTFYTVHWPTPQEGSKFVLICKLRWSPGTLDLPKFRNIDWSWITDDEGARIGISFAEPFDLALSFPRDVILNNNANQTTQLNFAADVGSREADITITIPVAAARLDIDPILKSDDASAASLPAISFALLALLALCTLV